MAVPVHGLPHMLTSGLEVALVPPALKRSRFDTVVHVESAPNGQLITFSHVDNLNDAEDLVGKTIMVREDALPERQLARSEEKLIGREIVNKDRISLGSITSILQSPAQDVWEIKHPSGQMWMLPAVDDFIVSWPKTGPIVVDPPAGLIPEDTHAL